MLKKILGITTAVIFAVGTTITSANAGRTWQETYVINGEYVYCTFTQYSDISVSQECSNGIRCRHTKTGNTWYRDCY